jgi:hypothetical protein
MEATKKIPGVPPEVLSLEDVQRRVPLLKRIVRDVVESFEGRRKSKEFLEELTIISRKFSSSEIEETMNSLRRGIGEADRLLESLEKEVLGLGGKLRDPSRGLTYFYSDRDSRRIFLIWDLREPDLLTWHELDETFSDRLPVDFSESGNPPGGRRQEPSTP